VTPFAVAALAWLSAQPVHHLDVETPEERAVRLETIAVAADAAVSRTTWKGPRIELLAAVLVTGKFEGGDFAQHIHEDRCRPNECDRGKAKSSWQLHAIPDFPLARWFFVGGSDEASTQRAADEATRRLVRSFGTCATRGQPGWTAAFSLYGSGYTCELTQFAYRTREMQRVIVSLRQALPRPRNTPTERDPGRTARREAP
jgi:hypothetical protein